MYHFFGLLALPAVVAAAGLHELSVAAGWRYFGTATDNHELSDEPYVRILSDTSEFGQITVGNGQKWQFTQPSRGQFDYSVGDVVVNLAEGNGQIIRCHTLLWHQQLPSWVSDGTWTVPQLTSVIETHIANVAGHYRGKCYAWDVVNEALEEDGTYRNSVFYRVLGSSFLPISFKAARAADPVAKLYYNDYNIEAAGSKQRGVLKVISDILDAGAPIDGIGCQAHLIVGSTPSRSALAGVLNSYVDAGVKEVTYTELDLRIQNLPSTAQLRQQQVTDYLSVFGACLDVDACVGITIWDYTDKYSWIPSVFPGEGEALLYDENLNRKPVWTSVSSLLAAAATASVPDSCSLTTTRCGTTGVTTTAVPTPTPTAYAQRWEQCGGIQWTGPTVCQPPWTCKKENEWWSQCL